MSLNETIAMDMKTAMKEGNKFALSVLRMLKSALQLESISKKKELTDEEVITVVKRNVKQRKDSISEYQKYNKLEEIESLHKEIEILEKYLPSQMSMDEVEREVSKALEELNAQSIKDMGRVMKYLTDKIGAQADMGVVSSLVKSKLS